ncbi:tail protein X [Shinella sp. JR1-6]|uniref:tail protein X n=1 Tax=Shinella sp. JR1-6 TaxID=2527671 RepID=UPI00102D4ED6|nr:tail protein X [Shinella sp. JR1-6]TAA54646.1 phage tail protein [Shinella sp. JR1-6]
MDSTFADRIVKLDDGTDALVTADGDMIDAVAHYYYGSHERNTERIYEANPGLASWGEILPAGLVVLLPPRIIAPVIRATRKLWETSRA